MLTNYEIFLKAANKAAGFIGAFVQYQLYLNRLHCRKNVFYVDSMPVSVCKTVTSPSHKVMKGLIDRGKSSKGWFFGFKLQEICTTYCSLIKRSFRPAENMAVALSLI